MSHNYKWMFDELGVARPVPTDGGYHDYLEGITRVRQRLYDMGKLTQRGRPSLIKMIRAMCYQCMGGFVDGRSDCEVQWCPLYPLQPYRKFDPDLTWVVAGSHVKSGDRLIPKEISLSEEDECLTVQQTEEGSDNAN